MPSMPKVRVVGPLQPHAEGFAGELSALGYTRWSGTGQLQLLAHLSRWMTERGLEDGPLSSEHLVAFVAARREAGYRVYRSVRGMAVLWSYLSACGLTVAGEAAPPSPAEVLIERYRDWLTGDRGVTGSSARIYISAIRGFVAERARTQERATRPHHAAQGVAGRGGARLSRAQRL